MGAFRRHIITSRSENLYDAIRLQKLAGLTYWNTMPYVYVSAIRVRVNFSSLA